MTHFQALGACQGALDPRALPEESRAPPAEDLVLPEDPCALPEGNRVPPEDPFALPEEDRVLPADPRVLPEGNRVPPAVPCALPGEDRVLPAEDRVLPAEDRVLPEGTRGLRVVARLAPAEFLEFPGVFAFHHPEFSGRFSPGCFLSRCSHARLTPHEPVKRNDPVPASKRLRLHRRCKDERCVNPAG